MTLSQPRPELALLLQAIDEAFDAPSWHGPNLMDSLKGVGAEEAVWRPTEGMHNIQELVVHAAYWKNKVRGRITGGHQPFPEGGDDWFRRVGDGSFSLPDDLKTLETEHRALRQALETLPESRLGETVSGDHGSIRQNVLGVALHDVYHAGQIQFLRKLQRVQSLQS